MPTRFILQTLALMTVTAVLMAADAPPRLRVEPREAPLQGHRAAQQLLVSETQADGAVSDVTSEASFESTAPAIALVTSTGRIIPRGQGTTEVVVKRKDETVRIPVTVSNFSRPDP